MTYSYLSQPEIIIFMIAAVWAFFWKAIALWHAARRNESTWYILLLIINSIGILEIIYLYTVVKIPGSSASQKSKKSSRKK